MHLLTTGTLNHLRTLSPTCDFDERRFRPNVVIATESGSSGFVEQAWVGRTLQLGESVRLHIAAPTERCVMTTLRQPGLEHDAQILRAIARHGQGKVGVYATVIAGGVIRCGDPVWL